MPSIVALALLAFYAFALGALYGHTPGWLIDASGWPRTNEFLGVRAAGDLALQGLPWAGYDWARHEAQLATISGRPVTAYFPWPYPPTYLFVAVALAKLPYMISALIWIATTALVYAWAMSRVAGFRAAGLWALASPATAFNAFVAHTGFWTAGVMTLALDGLIKRPIVAGVLLGLLTTKPQLGVLIPIALMAGGHWRVIGAATATTVVLVVASLAVFGVAPWQQFVVQMTVVGDSVRYGHVRFGDINFNLLATLYGFLRALGISDGPAFLVQLAFGAAMVALVALLWRSRAPLTLKSAGLMSASLLATPYLFVYDLTHLSGAMAFLVASTGLGGLRRVEIAALVGAMAMILMQAFVPMPLVFLANAHVGAVVLARAWPFVRAEAEDAYRGIVALARRAKTQTV